MIRNKVFFFTVDVPIDKVYENIDVLCGLIDDYNNNVF